MFPRPDGDQGKKGGKGRRRENGHVACYSHVSACARYSLVCTLLPLTLIRRASYFYSAGCELHCLPATLSGHGYSLGKVESLCSDSFGLIKIFK